MGRTDARRVVLVSLQPLEKPMRHRKLFVNLPVRDLQRSVAFFTALGFEFNAAFGGEQNACMVISDQATVMLLAEPFFKTLTPLEVCDTRTHVEALLTVSCARRDEVESLVKTAIEHGGRPGGEPQDHGFMFDWGFYDLDGHGWGVMWMNPDVGGAQSTPRDTA